MTESNPVQVTLSDDGIRINAVTDQAKSTDQDVKNLYDPNMMSVIEKQGTTARFAGETSRYNVLLARAKDAGIDTKELESSYATLNTFMGTVIGTGDKASDIDRDKYAEALADFNNKMAIMQDALDNAFNKKIAANSAAVSDAAVAVASADTHIKEGETAASQALSEANVSVEKADETASAVKVVSQDVTTLKGGSTATLAQLETGIQSKVNSSDYNSKITQLDNQIQSVVVNRSNLVPYSGYWTSLVGWTLEAWGDPAGTLTLVHHSLYHNAKDNTLCVGTAATNGKSAYSERFPVKPNTTYTVSFSGFASGNVKGSAVYFLGRSYTSSNDYDTNGSHNIVNNLIMSPSGINRYHGTFTTSSTETEGYIRLDNGGSNNGLSSGSYFAEIKMEEGATATSYERDGASSEIVQLSDDINLRVKKDDVINQVNVSTEGVLIDGSHVSITGKTHIDNGSIDVAAIKNLTADSIKAGTITAKVSINAPDITGGNVTGTNIVANTFSTANGTFTVDDKGNVTATSLSLIGNKNFVYNSELMANGAGWNITNGGYVTTSSAHNGTPGIGINSTAGAGVWHVFGESKKVPFTGSNSNKYSASAWFIDWGSQAGATYQFTLAFNDSNGNRLPGYVGYTYYATGHFHDWQLFTINGVTPPAGSATVSVQYWFSNGQSHAAFSQPMLTQSDRYQGYTSDTGNILSAGQVILDNNGTLTTTYDGISQDDDNHYHAWTLNGGTLKIGRGYITADSNGSRTISGNTSNVGNVKSTLSASYIKFTSATGGRTYMDADLISLSTGSLNDLVVINSNGIHIADQGIEIKGGVNASTTWGQFNQIRIGQSAHTINSVDGSLIGFQSGYGNTGNFVRVKAAGYDTPSLASLKKEVIPYDDKGSVVANTDLATYKYKAEGNTDGQHMGPILDDVNDKKAYYTRQEITAFDGSGIDTTRSLFYGWSAVKALQRENEQMQIRLRKLEITEETNNG